jgi:ribosomal protein S18 acetylase RimI-like enzyme
MAELVEPLRPTRVLDNWTRREPIRGFSCGAKGRSWEVAVNEWAQRVASDRLGEQQSVILLEDGDGKLVGLGSYKPKAVLSPLHRQPLITAYVHMIGTDYRYHRQRLHDGSSAGDALLGGMLEHVRVTWGGVMPYMTALVNPRNAPSHSMFDRHGFGEIAPTGRGDALRIRAPW